MTQLAYVSDCALHTATLAVGAYQPAGQWDPAQAYGDGKQCYAGPVFKDGRILARLGTSKGDFYHLVSVDPGDPKTPRETKEPAPRVRKSSTRSLGDPARTSASTPQMGRSPTYG